MVERWKLNAARSLERIAPAAEKIARELERQNDLRERELELAEAAAAEEDDA